jgi:glycosyltransferase involved in cell wall biosynthesis
MRTLLITAYACEPLKGSEQAVGWNFVLQLARYNKVHVITRANNRIPIEQHIPVELTNNISFHYYDAPASFRNFKKKSKGIYLYYIIWQIGIIRLIRHLIKQEHFSYSIHLTFGNIWLPTFLPMFNIPFIYGPIGGGEGIPNAFIGGLTIQQRLIQIFRCVLKGTARFNPLIAYVSARSRVILCRTHDTMALFPSKYKSKLRLLEDGAIEPEIFKIHAPLTIRKRVKIISTSRLIGFKNVNCLVDALRYVSAENDLICTIIGDGPEKGKIKNNALSIIHRVEFKEGLSRNEVLKELEDADIFISTSLRDACNLSLLEAMAVGLPVICLNWSGMAVATDDSCAIRIPVTNPTQMPIDMAKAIQTLIDDLDLRRRMGEAGRERIRKVFNWEAKGEFMENLLKELDSSAS